MYRLIALLNDTTPRDYAVVPLLFRRDGDPDYRDYGIGKDARLTFHSEREFQRMQHLVRHVRRHGIEFDSEPKGLAGLWLGSGFNAACEDAKIPAPRMPMIFSDCMSKESPLELEGCFTIMPEAACHAWMEAWIEEAAAPTLRRRCLQAAGIMRRAMPLHSITLASQWAAGGSDLSRRDAVSRALRINLTSEKDLSRADIERRFKECLAAHTKIS